MAAMRVPTSLLDRSRKIDRRTEAGVLRMELIAAGQEMASLGCRLEMALQAADPSSLVGYIAARLQVLGTAYVAEGRFGPDDAA